LEPFLDRVFGFLKTKGLTVETYELDHVCFRTSTREEYRDIVSRIVEDGAGTLATESMIGGRPIACIELTEPIAHGQWRIRCLEVPCPKAGRAYKSGFEHVEFAIGGADADGSGPIKTKPLLEAFMGKRPDLLWSTRALDKDVNADVSLSIPPSGPEQDEISIKFHAMSLLSVVQYESDHGLVEKVPDDYFQ